MDKKDYITRVETNVKGAPVSVELGRHTLLLGPCGSGKTRLCNAVELALTGRATDVAGADRAAVADLIPMGPVSGELYARATTDGGDRFTWSTTIDSKGKGKRPARYADNALAGLPLRDVTAALRASGAKARGYLLPLIAAGADELLAERDAAKATLRDLAAQRKAAQAVVDGAGGSGTRPPSEDDLARAASAVTSAEKQVATAHAFHARGSDADLQASRAAELDRIKGEYRSSNDQRVELTRQLGAMQNELACLPARDTVRIERGAMLVTLAQWQTSKNAPACALCGGATTPDALAAQRARLEAACAQLAQRNAQRDPLVSRIEETRAALDRRVEAMAQLQAMANTLARVQRGVAEAAAPVDPGVSVDEATAALTAARDQHTAMVRAEAQWAALAGGRDRLARLEAEHAAVKERVAQLEDEVSTRFDEAIAAFTRDVNALLPKDDTFGIVVTRKSLRAGLFHNGRLNTALSGAEWARVTASIAAVVSVGLRVPVIIPEERAYDPATLALTMRALGRTEAQVILTSTVKYKGKKPAGWTVVDVTELVESDAEPAESDPERDQMNLLG